VTIAREAYTIDEAAQLLGGVSRRSIYNWIEHFGLNVTKVGSRPMILREDLEEFRTRHRQSVAA
jgi:excisionase family DNA binding protein